MDDNSTISLIALLFFAAVIICALLAFRLVDRRRIASQLGARDIAALEQMHATAQRMEQRMAVLERILDAEAPSWRNNAEMTGGIYGR